MEQKVQREGDAQTGKASTVVCVTQERRNGVKEFQKTFFTGVSA